MGVITLLGGVVCFILLHFIFCAIVGLNPFNPFDE